MQLEELIEYNQQMRNKVSDSKKESRILEQVLAIEVLAMPKRANTPSRADPSKHC
ncbi:hypothetical protein JHK84_040091 [Glycine max]|nr:hypothetical protein JHK84_040091 [Glycine max]